MKLKILDLFSGLGGFSLGLERTGHFKTVAFCDNDKYCNLLLQKHWKGVKIYNNVKEITKEKLIADGVKLPDIITGGFPCQPFSVAGKQAGTADDSHLWPVMFRIIQEFTPRWVIGENVKGLTNIQDGVVFETVCTNLVACFSESSFESIVVGVLQILIAFSSTCSLRFAGLDLPFLVVVACLLNASSLRCGR